MELNSRVSRSVSCEGCDCELMMRSNIRDEDALDDIPATNPQMVDSASN